MERQRFGQSQGERGDIGGGAGELEAADGAIPRHAAQRAFQQDEASGVGCEGERQAAAFAGKNGRG